MDPLPSHLYIGRVDLSDPAQVKEACWPENHQWLTQFENRSKGGVRRG